MKEKKAKTYIEGYAQRTGPNLYNRFLWTKAICEVIIGDFSKAQIDFERASFANIENPIIWIKSVSPDQFSEVCMMSGKEKNLALLEKAISDYRNNEKWKNSLPAHIAYGFIGLLFPELEWVERSIFFLASNGNKQVYSLIGDGINSIWKKDENGITESIYNLLKIHKISATNGSLRGIPEGWLCLPAMSLGFLALREGIKIKIINEYFYQDYLEFTLSNDN